MEINYSTTLKAGSFDYQMPKIERKGQKATVA